MNLSEEHIKEIAEIGQRSKSNSHRLDVHDEKFKEQEKKLDELSNVYIALTKVDDKVSNVEKDVSTIKSDLKTIKEKPIKRYEQIISIIISRYSDCNIGIFNR